MTWVLKLVFMKAGLRREITMRQVPIPSWRGECRETGADGYRMHSQLEEALKDGEAL